MIESLEFVVFNLKTGYCRSVLTENDVELKATLLRTESLITETLLNEMTLVNEMLLAERMNAQRRL